VLVPDADELVALGAAVQAAACLAGEQPVDVAGRWGKSAGSEIEPDAAGGETLERIRATRAATLALHEGG
jgi:xylulokinase